MPVSFAPTMRANRLITTGSYVLPMMQYPLNNCKNTLCYTYNHNYVNNRNNARGKIGTSSSSYLASRKRI